MTIIILLFSLGILLLALEVIVPGAILGSIGGLLMFIGCVIAFVTFGNNGGLLAVLAAFAISGLAFFIEFRILPKTRFGQRAFLTREITAVAAALGSEARELIGKSAKAVTPLVPSGYILVDGCRHEAFCLSGYAPVGSFLEITGADSFRLIVKISKKLTEN